jgi:hypothetical protein
LAIATTGVRVDGGWCCGQRSRGSAHRSNEGLKQKTQRSAADHGFFGGQAAAPGTQTDADRRRRGQRAFAEGEQRAGAGRQAGRKAARFQRAQGCGGISSARLLSRSFSSKASACTVRGAPAAQALLKPISFCPGEKLARCWGNEARETGRCCCCCCCCCAGRPLFVHAVSFPLPLPLHRLRCTSRPSLLVRSVMSAPWAALPVPPSKAHHTFSAVSCQRSAMPLASWLRESGLCLSNCPTSFHNGVAERAKAPYHHLPAPADWRVQLLLVDLPASPPLPTPPRMQPNPKNKTHHSSDCGCPPYRGVVPVCGLASPPDGDGDGDDGRATRPATAGLPPLCARDGGDCPPALANFITPCLRALHAWAFPARGSRIKHRKLNTSRRDHLGSRELTLLPLPPAASSSVSPGLGQSIHELSGAAPFGASSCPSLNHGRSSETIPLAPARTSISAAALPFDLSSPSRIRLINRSTRAWKMIDCAHSMNALHDLSSQGMPLPDPLALLPLLRMFR